MMRIFIERFVLAILAALAVLLAITNPMGFSGTARVIGVIVIVILAAVAAYFAERHGELRWERVRRLWRRTRDDRYLSSTDTDLGSAIKMMAWASAWGKWFSAQLLANQDRPIDKEGVDRQVMQIAASLVTDAATDGKLEIRGRPPNSISYEVIPREAWRLVALHMHPDLRSLWRVGVFPRGVAVTFEDGKPDIQPPARVAHIFEYDSLIVDSRKFEQLWPKKDRATDRARHRLLLKAARRGVIYHDIVKGLRG
jgi:hypothetical protein